jgi:hypothetical protein
LSVSDTLLLLENYNELNWFFERLKFDHDKKETEKQIRFFEAVNIAQNAKSDFKQSWLNKKIDLLNSQFVDLENITYFEKLKLSYKKKPLTLFQQLKLQRKKI